MSLYWVHIRKYIFSCCAQMCKETYIIMDALGRLRSIVWWTLGYPWSIQQSLIRLHCCVGWFEYLQGAYDVKYIFSCYSSNGNSEVPNQPGNLSIHLQKLKSFSEGIKSEKEFIVFISPWNIFIRSTSPQSPNEYHIYSSFRTPYFLTILVPEFEQVYLTTSWCV